jgi:hypothetical protein
MLVVAVMGCGGGNVAVQDGGAGAGLTAGSGGQGGNGGTGGGSGLPRCGVTTHAQDPANDGGAIPAMCNTLAFGAGWVIDEGASTVPVDGGLKVDGGVEYATGGAIADGDYDLVRWQQMGAGGPQTRRSLRVFGGATFIEWLADNQDTTPEPSVVSSRFNTNAAASGTMLGISVVCGQVAITSGYAYSAANDQLVLFYEGLTPGPTVFSVFVYQRTCAR